MRHAPTAIGQIQGARESQQDAAKCLEWQPGKHLLVVADGIGGAAGGEVASEAAVSGFVNAFSLSTAGDIRNRLLLALDCANMAVGKRLQQDPALNGMGTTLIAVVIADASLLWLSVGDSPLWLFRNRSITRLNENHSLGGLLDMQAQAGEISAAQAAHSKQRGVLLSAIQGDNIPHLDAPSEAIPLLPGDTVIAATDGIETCTGDDLCDIVTAGKPPAEDIVGAVLDAVADYERPGQDNATLIVYRPM